MEVVGGRAEAPMVTEIGPKLPAGPVPASARSVVPAKMSAPSRAPNPVPETVTTKPGGPVAGDSRTPPPDPGQAPYQVQVGNPVPPEGIPVIFPGSKLPGMYRPGGIPENVVIN